jgi:ABC-type antimicrobial peptide transport system permease subunit
VGVVGEVRHDALDLPPRDELFFPLAQVPFGSMTFVLASDRDPAAVLQPAQAAIWAIDPMQTIYDAATITGLMRASVAPRRFALTVTSAYGVVALALAALGVYGVMAVSTRQRTREIGVRMALGATSPEILRLVMRRGLALGGVGLVVGLGAALVAGRLLSGQLYATSPADPATLATVAALVLGVTTIACYGPARRAAKIDPIHAIREP